MPSALEAVLRRDRQVVLSVLVLLAGLAWLYLYHLAAGMEISAGAAMTMDGMANMSGMLAPGPQAWSVYELALLLAMWSVMMVGMMLPSAAPMILIYARVGRTAAAQDKLYAPALWFGCGYLLSWFVFAIAATGVQALLEQTLLLTPMMDIASPIFGGVLLIAVGIYQWTPLKESCLSHCQSPLSFIQRHGGFRRRSLPALALGFRHGAYCVGCCWMLMALLFVGGVMNLLWIFAIAIFILAEKILPAGRALSRSAGLGLIAAGALLLSAPLKL